MFDISLEGKAPIYEQLFDGISALISSGQLTPDERLPAVREVAASAGVDTADPAFWQGALELFSDKVKQLEEYLLDGFDATTESAYYQKTTGK